MATKTDELPCTIRQWLPTLDTLTQRREINVAKYNQRLISNHYASATQQRRGRISRRYGSQLEFSDEELDYIELWEWSILFHFDD